MIPFFIFSMTYISCIVYFSKNKNIYMDHNTRYSDNIQQLILSFLEEGRTNRIYSRIANIFLQITIYHRVQFCKVNHLVHTVRLPSQNTFCMRQEENILHFAINFLFLVGSSVVCPLYLYKGKEKEKRRGKGRNTECIPRHCIYNFFQN